MKLDSGTRSAGWTPRRVDDRRGDDASGSQLVDAIERLLAWHGTPECLVEMQDESGLNTRWLRPCPES